MHPCRCWLQVDRAVVILLGLLVSLSVATRVAAQETVHHALAQLSPGQPKGATTAPVLIEEFSDFQRLSGN